MANIKLHSSGKRGFDMYEDLDISTLGTYDHFRHSSSQAKFFDNGQNYTLFSGSGFRYQFSNGELTDIKGGMITSMKVVDHGETTITVSGLRASAAKIFDFYAEDEATQAIQYMMKGNDTITGTKRADLIHAGSGMDKATAGSGDDSVWGEDGDDSLNGGNGNDYVDGGIGNDSMKAGSGNDHLVGGNGDDILSGQGGADMFIFGGGIATADLGSDTITDFNDNELDSISLAGIDANRGLTGDQAFRFMGTDAFSGYAGEVRYVTSGDDTFVQLDISGSGIAEITIQLKGLHVLSADDFVL